MAPCNGGYDTGSDEYIDCHRRISGRVGKHPRRTTRISTALRSNLAFRNHYLCRALVADNSLFSRVHPQAPVQVVSIHRLPLSHSARLSSRPHDFATSLCPSTLLSRSRRITSALLPLARRVAPVASRLRLCTALRTVTHQFEACPKS